MGVFGHIMKYILIVLVCVLVVLILACAAMFLFPNFKLFGYHYVSSGLNQTYEEFLRGDDARAQAEWDNADIIRIDTAGYDVNFYYASDDLLVDDGDVVVQVVGTYRGFVKGSVDKPTYSSSNSTFDETSEDPNNSYYKDETRPDKKIYFIHLQEPEQGFLIRNGTAVNFIFTTNALANKDVEIFTGGGSVRFGEEEMMSCNNLNISCGSGAVLLNNVVINTYIDGGIEKAGNLEITKNKGKVDINTNQKANVRINVSGGMDTINLKDIESTSLDVSKLTISSHNGSVNVGNVYGDFECSCNSAKLNVGNITGAAKVVVKETVCHFGTVGTTAQVDTLSIEANGKASLEFEKVFCKIDVTKNANAKITILESLGDINYRADGGKGSLDLQNVHASKVNIVSTSGKVIIRANKNEKVDITSTATSGTIEFSGIQLGKVEINTENEQSSCNIIGSFEKVVGRHVIKTTSGKIDIRALQEDTYSIFWFSNKASLDIFGNLRTTAVSSEEYCRQKGITDTSIIRATAYGEPCLERANSLDLVASSGTVVVSAL